MQMFLERFNASKKSYTKKTVKMIPFYWFFEFFAHKELSDFYNFCTSYSIYCTEALCKFLQKPIQFIIYKAQKHLFWAYF